MRPLAKTCNAMYFSKSSCKRRSSWCAPSQQCNHTKFSTNRTHIAHYEGQYIRTWCTEVQGVRAELTVSRAGQVGFNEVPWHFWQKTISVYNIIAQSIQSVLSILCYYNQQPRSPGVHVIFYRRGGKCWRAIRKGVPTPCGGSTSPEKSPTTSVQPCITSLSEYNYIAWLLRH